MKSELKRREFVPDFYTLAGTGTSKSGYLVMGSIKVLFNFMKGKSHPLRFLFLMLSAGDPVNSASLSQVTHVVTPHI